MKTTITFEIDTDDLTSFTDQHLADLWHVAQANPAPFGNRDACWAAEYVGREIIRRFLSNTAPNLWSHQGAHINAEAFVAEVAEVAEQAQTIRAPYTATATTCTCGAQDKDRCTCNSDSNRSYTASANSGVALSSNTD